jgi:hypothetical protein
MRGGATTRKMPMPGLSLTKEKTYWIKIIDPRRMRALSGLGNEAGNQSPLTDRRRMVLHEFGASRSARLGGPSRSGVADWR